MKILRFERNDEAVAWAKKTIGVDGLSGDVTSVSLVDDNDEFLAVTVFSSYTRTNIDMHIAARPKSNWVSRGYFHAVFELPFLVLEVPRITGLIRAQNLRAQRFVSRLGFQYEGRMRKAFPDGEDLVIYGLLREEYLKHSWSKHETNRATEGLGDVLQPEPDNTPATGGSDTARGPETVA
jgi:RimJ/RimL family protein N-acetyltransferase